MRYQHHFKIEEKKAYPGRWELIRYTSFGDNFRSSEEAERVRDDYLAYRWEKRMAMWLVLLLVGVVGGWIYLQQVVNDGRPWWPLVVIVPILGEMLGHIGSLKRG